MLSNLTGGLLSAAIVFSFFLGMFLLIEKLTLAKFNLKRLMHPRKCKNCKHLFNFNNNSFKICLYDNSGENEICGKHEFAIVEKKSKSLINQNL
jgi:hypothetical protein